MLKITWVLKDQKMSCDEMVCTWSCAIVPFTHVWIITRQSKDAYEQSWILWNVVGYKSTSEVEMTAYIRTWESCNGLAMPTSLKDFLQGNMQHTHTQEVQQLLEVFHLKDHWVSTDVVIFYVEFSSKKKQPCYHHLSSIRWEELDAKEAEHRSVSRDLINLKEDTEWHSSGGVGKVVLVVLC